MKVSVIIPVYNKADYLKDLFESLQKQTFEDFECILIDDGSVDGSGTLCDEISDIDRRFQVIHIFNGGVSHARNIGLEISRGNYITFIDADDKVPENYLYCLYKGIIDNKADLLICSITKMWKSGKKQCVNLPGNGFYHMADILKNFAVYQKETGIFGYCCGKIISRELVGKTRFDEKIQLAEDFDFFLKLYPKVQLLFFTQATTYFYVQETENSSAIIDDNMIDYRMQLIINLRYKNFLQSQGEYTDNNRKIVSQLLSNYIFFTLFYSEIGKLDSCFQELWTIYKNEHIELYGRNIFEKWIFCLFKHKRSKLIKKSLAFYRMARRLLRKGQ